MSDLQRSKITSDNQRYWEALAPHRLGEPIDFFQQGNSALTDNELAVIGDVSGRRVLHLACSMGDESLSFAQLGADVTAVDFAPRHLATGREKASALGLKITFIEQDMTRLQPEITGFDLIYISWGGICWIPDLDEWARMVAGRLNPNGRLVISEHHPLWEILSATENGDLRVSGDYFNSGRDGYPDPMKAPQVTQQIGVPSIEHRSFVWNLGSVVSAALAAGLTVDTLQEFSEVEMYPGLGVAAARLPATYLLSATRR